MSLGEIVREAVALQQKKEDENTWSKINDVLLRLTAAVGGTEDAKRVLRGAEELIVRSMQSDRSKLAGTALGLLKSCICILGSEFEMAGQYLGPLVKVCGKSSRVFYSRGEEVLVELCRNVNVGAYTRFFNECSGSANKNVRVAIFKGIEEWARRTGRMEGFEGLVAKGRRDAISEVRDMCKRMVERYGTCEEKGEQSSISKADGENLRNEMKREPVRMVRRPVRLGSEVMSGIERGGVEKKELAPRFSPLRKQSKTGGIDHDKIKELSRQVKDIASDIKPEMSPRRNGRDLGIGSRIREILSGVKRDKGGTVHPERKDEAVKSVISHEDLTPVRLDKYLNKYREEHGNLGAKKEAVLGSEFDVKDAEVDETLDGSKLEAIECIGRYESKEPNSELKDRIIIGHESLSEEIEDELDVEDGGEGGCPELGVGELSKSLANISINEGDAQDCQDALSLVSAPSGNPYESCAGGHEIESSFKEYTIVESGERECQEVQKEEDEGHLLEAGVSGSCMGKDVSIEESTIPMDSCVESEVRERSRTPDGRKKAFEAMRGNRFAGLLELSESSGEETVFSGKPVERKEGEEWQMNDANDFTSMDSSVEIKRGVFRKG
uniref:CLASP N-terminal domain-containing protein n=1 Tax=Encephalitozoon cuniculi TaxID=6035 RepID=M1K567_ENCCN|nr:hypothetical protein ECU10_1030 [Encephalitozoon cuniculi]